MACYCQGTGYHTRTDKKRYFRDRGDEGEGDEAFPLSGRQAGRQAGRLGRGSARFGESRGIKDFGSVDFIRYLVLQHPNSRLCKVLTHSFTGGALTEGCPADVCTVH
jgi:hypothetical protein